MLAFSPMARLLALLPTARKELATNFPTRHPLLVARVREGELHPVRAAILLYGHDTRGAGGGLRVARMLRWVAALPRDNARVVAPRWLRSTRHRWLDDRLPASAKQRLKRCIAAWGAKAFVAQLPTLVNSAWSFFLAHFEANVVLFVAAQLLALMFPAVLEGVTLPLTENWPLRGPLLRLNVSLNSYPSPFFLWNVANKARVHLWLCGFATALHRHKFNARRAGPIVADKTTLVAARQLLLTGIRAVHNWIFTRSPRHISG